MEIGQTIFHFQRWHLYPHKRNNKEDVTGWNGVIWPCWLGEVLLSSGLSNSTLWRVNPSLQICFSSSVLYLCISNLRICIFVLVCGAICLGILHHFCHKECLCFQLYICVILICTFVYLFVCVEQSYSASCITFATKNVCIFNLRHCQLFARCKY